MKALVTGGTGTLGRLFVPKLRDAGYDVRVLSRHHYNGPKGIEVVTGDLGTGEGIDAAVEGMEIIVHCASSFKGDEDKARHLIRAATRSGPRHLVTVSVVGTDRVPITSSIDRAMFGYLGSKLAVERIVADSGLPWTTMRATQFHDLILIVVQQLAKLPVIPVPSGFRFQPIDAADVADRLRGTGAWRTGRASARHGRSASVRDGRTGPQLPASPWHAPPDPAHPAPRQGRPRVPSGCEPRSGPGGGPPDMGGLPGDTDEFAYG